MIRARLSQPWFPALALAALAVLGTSCSKDSVRKVCYPVTGQVLVRGKPATGALVMFYPLNKGDKPVTASGVVDEQGRFTLSTYESADGAPAGEYQIAITWHGDEGFKHKAVFKKKQEPDQLKDRYRDPATSGLHALVEEGPTELPPFNLR